MGKFMPKGVADLSRLEHSARPVAAPTLLDKLAFGLHPSHRSLLEHRVEHLYAEPLTAGFDFFGDRHFLVLTFIVGHLGLRADRLR